MGRARVGRAVQLVLVGLAFAWAMRPAAGQGQNVEVVGQIGGWCSAVYAQGNYAYVGEGPSLLILDITDPFSPSPLGRVCFTEMVEKVFVQNNRAYVATGSTGLQIVDVSNPQSPVLLGTYDTPVYARSVYVVGNLAYIADAESGLQIVDVSDPSRPTYRGSWNAPGIWVHFEDVWVSGGYAYAADNGAGLRILDVHNPSSPTLVGFFPCAARRIALSGGMAYLGGAGGWTNFSAIDISIPSSPTLRGSIPTYRADCFFVSGDLAYIGYLPQWGDEPSVLTIYDVSNPQNIQGIGQCTVWGRSSDVFVQAGMAYWAVGNSGMVAVDVSEPSKPTVRGTHVTIGSATEVFCAAGHAYIADYVQYCTGGFEIADVTDPRQPKIVGWIRKGGSWGTSHVFVQGNTAYMMEAGYFGSFRFSVVDVAIPSSPTVRGSYDTAGGRFFVSNQLAYITKGGDGLLIIDVTQPTTPTLRGSYNTPRNALGVAVSGGLAYVADEFSLQIIDVSNPTSPTYRGSYQCYARNVHVAGNVAYVASERDGLHILDVTDPTSPTQLAKCGGMPSWWALDVYVENNLAHVATTDGYLVLDVSNPRQPSVVGQFLLRGAWGVFVSEGLTYLASQRSGVQILRYCGLPPGTLLAPSNLTATAVSPRQINLSWQDNSDNDDGFELERKTGASGIWVRLWSFGSLVTTHQDRAVLPNTTYYYRVRARNGTARSAWSNEAMARTVGDPIITLYNGPDRFGRMQQAHSVCADGTAATLVDLAVDPALEPALFSVTVVSSGLSGEDGEIRIQSRAPGRITARYTSPENFCRSEHAEDKTAMSRTITLRVTHQGILQATPGFSLYRPPVVMLHGIWGSASRWAEVERYLNDSVRLYPPALLLAYDYSFSNAASFSENWFVGSVAVLHGLDEAHINGYSASKVDVLSHSMGGILARWYLNGVGGHSYHYDIHKLVTICTPHSGTQAANLLMGDSVLQFLFHKREYWTDRGAVKDLCVDSTATQSLNESPQPRVASHAIRTTAMVADGDSAIETVYWYIALRRYRVLDRDLVQWRLFGELGDLIVPVSSQGGGLLVSSTYSGQYHIGAQSNDAITSFVVKLLNEDIGGEYFTMMGFDPPVLSYTPPPFPASPRFKHALAAKQGALEITSPASGATVQAGSTITVVVSATSPTAEVLLVGAERGYWDSQPPFEIEFGIPPEILGQYEIGALGLSENSIVGTDTLSLNVVTSATLLDLETFPGESLLTVVGRNASVSVLGVYSDGVDRTITSSDVGTTYSITDPGIATVLGDGLIRGLSAGSSVLTIANGAIARDLLVTVLSEQEWNPTRAARWSLYR